MAWFPISHTVPQYVDTNGDPYSGAVLKAYSAGTSTNISLATDSSGGTTASSMALNSDGYPEVSGSIVIPHVNEKYKLALYPTQAAADSDTGAIWNPDNIDVGSDFGSTTEVISTSTVLDSSDAFTHKEISGTVTITLPSPGIVFTARNTGSGLVTFDPDGAETINGGATLILYPGDNGLFQYDSVNSTWSCNVGVSLGIGSSGQVLGTDGTNRTWQSALSNQNYTLQNASLSVSVNAGVITIALKGKDGNDPSSSNKVLIPFRSATDTDGVPVVREVTGALSMTISNGSSLGAGTNQAVRIWVGFIDNAGTVELCAFRPTDYTIVNSPVTLQNVISTTAEGGAGGADSALVAYSTSARSNVAFAYAGFFEIATSSGTWQTPTKVQTYLPGMSLPGDVIAHHRKINVDEASGTTTVPLDDSAPTSSEGTQFMTTTYTPKNQLNLIRVRHSGFYSTSAGLYVIASLFKSTTNVAARVVFCDTQQAADLQLTYADKANNTSLTFSVRAGTHSAGTTYFNSYTSSAVFGGVGQSELEVQEIMV